MAVNQNRYRQLQFIGGDILEARELNWLQEMAQGVAVTDNETSVDGELQSLYRQGAMMNVTVTTSGLTVTLSATNSALPMLIFVRDRWEIYPTTNDLVSDTTGNHPANHVITLIGTETTVYLNWQLAIRTGGLVGDDPTLTDATTNQSVASAGELILILSDTDTSGISLTGSQLAKNTSPIPLCSFINDSTFLTYLPTDNVLLPAVANKVTSGFVKTSTNTFTVVSTDDPRIGVASVSVNNGLVHDATVRTPVAVGGINSNGTIIYELPANGGTDIGGISASKVILLATKQLLEDGWNWLVASFNSLNAAFLAHFTAPLGLANTHPFPTPAQVGAAPISHVNLPLNSTSGLSHPPVINQDSGGFRVNHANVSHASNDPAYGVFDYLGNRLSSLDHSGDVYSSLANVYTATPGGSLTSGPLGLLSIVSAVLSQHVNQISHKNPHGLSTTDINAVNLSGWGGDFTKNGYLILPADIGGFILEWGELFPVTTRSTTTITFHKIFPNACLFVTAQMGASGFDTTGDGAICVATSRINGSQFLLSIGDRDNLVSGKTVVWFAIGF